MIYRIFFLLFITLLSTSLFAQEEEGVSMDDLEIAKMQITDSLVVLKKKYTSKLDSIEQRFSSQKDSLLSLNLSQNKVQQKLDSLQAKKDEAIASVNQKINELETSVNSKIENLNSRIQEKISVVDGLEDKAKAVTENIDNLPEFNSTDLDLNTTIPQVDLPKVDLPSSINKIEIDVNLSDLEINQLTSIPLEKKLELQNLPALQEWKDKLGQVSEYGKQLGEVADNIANLPKVAEQEVLKMEEFKELKEGLDEFEKLKKQKENLDTEMKNYQDKEYVKKKVINKVSNVANEKLSEQSTKIKEAQAKLAKYKQKYNSVQSIKDLPKHRPNAMKGKPLREKIVPGITIQSYKKNYAEFDFSPRISYRISGRLTSGIGGTYRIGIENDRPQLVKQPAVYGWRLYTDVKGYKSYFIHTEFEKINAPAPCPK